MLNYPGICRFGIATIKLIPFHVCKDLSIIYLMSGCLKFTTVAGTQTLREGQIEILNVKEPVMMEATGDSCQILYLSFDHTYLQKLDMDFECVTYNCNICNFFGAAAQKDHIDTLVRMVMRFMLCRCKGMPLMELEKEADRILDYIMEYFDDVGHVFSKDTKEDVNKERFQRISSYMIANVTRKISLNDIAQHEYLSAPYLSKEFTVKLEKNYNVIINYYRTINAVIQLLDTDNTLTYIAETSGFSSVRYYNKVFTEFLGCLPSKFRSIYKGKPHLVTDQKVNAEELTKIIETPVKHVQPMQISIPFAEDGQRIKHFVYSGYAKEPETCTFTIEKAPHVKKGIVLYIDDDTNRHIGAMAAEAISEQTSYLPKLQAPRREFRYLTESEFELKAAVQGEWKIELYLIT